MDSLLLKVFVFLRPVMFIDVQTQIAGFSLFELAAILLVGLLFVALILRAVRLKAIIISDVDILIVLFSLWCVTSYFINIGGADPKALLKLLLPTITYTISKNIIATKGEYLDDVFLLIIGFTVPIVISALMILKGVGVDKINYWTGEARYLGVYDNSHNMAHNMAFLIMVIAIYLALSNGKGGERRSEWLAPGIVKYSIFTVLSLLALFCLYKSAVRTSIVGLAIFFAIYVYEANRKLFIAAIVGCVLIVAAFPVKFLNLFPDFEKVATGEWDTGKLASSRPERWAEQLSNFSNLSIDHKLAGVGIGNQVDRSELQSGSVVAAVDSHNDFLDILTQTGMIGLVLLLMIQIAVLMKILALEGRERYVFLALFVAVNAMNFASNSYIARFGLGQMYFFILSFIEIRGVKREDRQTHAAPPGGGAVARRL